VNRIVITGLKPYDGRYDLDLNQELTTREWGWIKRYAGYLPLGLNDDAFGDPELLCVLAVIAMRRAGRVQTSEVGDIYERLSDTPFGETIAFEGEPEGEELVEDPSASSTVNANTSGGASKANSGSPANSPKHTGTPDSGTSASAPAISVN
jgi:hypothetical protein